jgi:hypothetical protein
MPRTGLILAAVAMFLALTAGAVCADVTYEQTTKMGGMAGMGGDTRTTTQISGDKMRKATSMTFSNPMMQKLAKGQDSAEITRLDRELVWKIDAKAKTYTETTFAQTREMMAKAMAMMKKNMGGDAPDVKSVVDVKTPGGTKTIAGVTCREVIITVTTPRVDEETGKTVMSVMRWDTWNAKDAPGLKEMEEFQRRYAEKMGFDEMAAMVGPMAQGMMGDMKELTAAMKKVGGFPLAFTMTMEGEGSGDMPPMSVSMETISISATGPDASAFEIPAGYKKVEAKESPMFGPR